MKISVITPSIRQYGLDIVRDSLLKQTYQDFNWLVSSPFPYGDCTIYIPRDIRAWHTFNNLLQKAIDIKTDLIICCVDLVALPPNAIEKFVTYYQNNQNSCVSMVGDHYKKYMNGELIKKCWIDCRRNQMQHNFEKSTLINFDCAVASFPAKGVLEVGGIDEVFDKYIGGADKEMIYRMVKIGYKIFLDKSIEFKRLCHDFEPIPDDSYNKFKAGEEYLKKCIENVINGSRLKLPYVK